MKKKWVPMPQKDLEGWLSEYVVSGLALSFHAKYKRWPTAISAGTVEFKDFKTKKGCKCGNGDGVLSVELR